MSRLSGNYNISGELRTGSLEVSSGIARATLAQEALSEYTIPLESLRVWDAYATNLPGTSANDDLGLYGGTFATDAPSIKTSDLKTVTATRYARFCFALPPEYVSGGNITVRLHAGMVTTAADTSATVDVECYLSDEEAGVGADLCSTAAQSCNNLTFADLDFTITPTSLAAGNVLDMRIALAVVDGASGTAVYGCIGAIQVLLTIRG